MNHFFSIIIFFTQDNLTRFIDNDQKFTSPKSNLAPVDVDYCERNDCEELPSIQVLKIRVNISKAFSLRNAKCRQRVHRQDVFLL